jgi:DNA segregation ATPase FtsK/SpoIIIE-like protein
MADNSRKKGSRDPGARLVSSAARSTSRVSGAAGSVGSQYNRSTRTEQRSDLPSHSSRQGSRSQSSAKAAARNKKGQVSSSRRSSTSRSNASPPGNTRDTQLINWMREQWGTLEAHQRQSIYGALLLVLSLLLFASLTVFRTVFILSGIYHFFMDFFGWSSYVLALGLVAFATAHLIEGLQKRLFIRWSLVAGLFCIWLLLLVESRLIFGPNVGILAELLVSPLLGWSPLVVHILVLGLLVVAFVVTFQISFGHVLMVARAIQRVLVSQQEHAVEEQQSSPSPYLGQRPRYSRYGTFQSDGEEKGEDPSATPAPSPGRQVGRKGRRSVVANVEEKDEGNIEFEQDFALEDDDPHNDINLHKQEIGLVPHGSREPLPLDISEHLDAVQGVKQQRLFLQGEQPCPSKRAANKLNEMEPLVPKQEAQAVAHAAPQSVSSWKLPDTSLLHNPEDIKMQMLGEDTASLARTIQETLRSFRVDAEVRQEDISIGPTIIRFGIRPTGKPEMTVDDKGRPVPVRDGNGNIVYESRTRVSRIMALQNDLALVLEAKTIRMEAPVPGRPYVGVEIPNKNSRLVTLREVLESKEYQLARVKSKLAIALGKDVAGQVRVGDLARMPHLLIAGATGAGKSVCINTIIASFLTQATPDDVRLLMVDPKMVELNLYNGIPHLLFPVVTEVEKVVPLLKNAINEMERRYRLFSQLGVRNLDGYHRLRAEKQAKGDTSLSNMHAIVIIIDELADLMMAAPEEIEGMICRLAQLARATGIHLVVATQRPSVDVITGLIKANIPTRISFMVSSAVDSRTIIDMGGAERLLGRGDMLYLPADAGRPERIQGAFLADEEVESLVSFWRQQSIDSTASDVASTPTQALVEPGWEIKEESADEFALDDELLDEAEEVVREYGKASISLLQRRLRIGYSRAARLIDLLEGHGIIGPAEQGGRSREILENGHGRNADFGEGHSMADEVADIVAEEKRDEFLRKQVEARKASPKGPENM